jgi:hypothetical protein
MYNKLQSTNKKIFDSYGKRYFKIGTKWYCSAGILFWRHTNDNTTKQYLIMHTDNINKKYNTEEFGGKSNSKVDFKIRDVAIRETMEESNGLFGKQNNNSTKTYIEIMQNGTQYLENYIHNNKNTHIIFNAANKYVTYTIEFPPMFNIQNIGEYEINDDDVLPVKRRFVWMTKKEILESNCINRLTYAIDKMAN